jgi:phosphatidylglycerol:prolipoprotein diacylglycerol transferase
VTDPFVHRIDPVLLQVGGLCLWWYGLSYSLGFLQIHWFLTRRHHRLALTRGEVYALSLLVAVGVLLGGRAIEVLFDEWPFYREHAWMVPAYWLGGMATHGLLLGAALGLMVFTYAYDKPLLELADELVIPGALLMGLGRLGNFIDGQIVGAPTDVWWGVQFPDAAGVRHPVVLYDAAKNLLLVPYLLWVRRTNPTPGGTAARFVFWYAFLRLFIDLFRDYPTHRLALGTGQTLNIVMTLLGAVLLWRSRARRLGRFPARPPWPPLSPRTDLDSPPSMRQRLALASVLCFCLTIPSNWTQDIPARYGARHAGLEHSWLYPQIDTAPRARRSSRLWNRTPGLQEGRENRHGILQYGSGGAFRTETTPGDRSGVLRHLRLDHGAVGIGHVGRAPSRTIHQD